MRTPLFTGSCPALVTPFDSRGDIHYEAFARQIERQLAHGVQAVCVCGTTGESAAMDARERMEAVEFCVSQVAGRAKVIAGTGSNDTALARRLTAHAARCGADGALVVTPYYNKTSQTGLVKHYESVASSADIPIILYNVPSRTGLSFTAETYALLAQNPQFNGVKEASGSLALMTRTRLLCGGDFTIWSGNDDQVTPMMALGAKGVITVAGNVVPDVMERLCRHCLEGRFDEAAALQLQYAPLFDALFCEVNPIPVKHAMNLLGLEAGTLRLPLWEISPEKGEKLRAVLTELKIL